MASTPWDSFVESFSPTRFPGADFLLGKEIRPTAEIAYVPWASSPPVSERPFAFGQEVLVAGAGFTAAIILTNPAAGGAAAAGEENPGCWFWFKIGAAVLSEDVAYTFTIAPFSALGLSAPSPPQAVNMSAQPARLAVMNSSSTQSGRFSSGTGPGITGGLTWDAVGGQSGPQGNFPWFGPFYKPQEHTAIVRAVTPTAACTCNYIWIENPVSRRVA